MLGDLAMDDRMKGAAAGIFFLGYILLQMPGGYVAQRWSAKKLISLCLATWGICAMACGMVHSFSQLAVARFFLGFAESGVFPAVMVLLSNWFPAGERVRATALVCLSQPLAVAATAPLTGWCLGVFGWRVTLITEGAFAILLLPIWWLFIFDRPKDARWLPDEERGYIEKEIAAEGASLEPIEPVPFWRILLRREVFLLSAICILYSSDAYGCMTFFTSSLRNREFTGLEYGILFAIPYLITAVLMILNSWHSDATRERRGHAAVALSLSGACLILSVIYREYFWISYAFMCFAIPGAFAVLGPFFAIPAEIFPRAYLGPLIGTVNSVGSLGGFFGPYCVGWLVSVYHSVSIPFVLMGIGMLTAAALTFLLPKAPKTIGA